MLPHSYSVIGIDEGQFFPGEALTMPCDDHSITKQTPLGMPELRMRGSAVSY